MLTINSMPILDLGDRPESFDPNKSESSQMFVAPKSKYPNQVIVKYADYTPEFKTKSLLNKYKKSALFEQGIDFIAFENSINNAARYLAPYRG